MDLIWKGTKTTTKPGTMLNRNTTYQTLLIILLLICHQWLEAFQTQLPITHQVQRGETLYRLSLIYNISIDSLKQINGLTQDIITTGQPLIVGYGKSSRKETNTELNSYERLISELRVVYDGTTAATPHHTINPYHSSSELTDLFEAGVIKSESVQLNNEIFEAEIKRLQGDIGLRTTARFTHNFEPGISDSEDVFFNNRLSIGLSWEILNDGFFGNKQKAQNVGTQKRINDLASERLARQQHHTLLHNHLMYSFNQIKLSYLSKHQLFLEELLQVNSKLYHIRAISWEEVMKLQSNITALEEAVLKMHQYNEAFVESYRELDLPEVNATTLPILAVDLKALLASAKNDSLNDQILQLERERLARETNIINQMSLRAQVRYNTLTGSLGRDMRNFASFELALSAPLFKNRGGEKLQQAKMDYLAATYQQEEEAARNELFDLYFRYEDVLKDYLEFHAKKLVVLERIRKHETRRSIFEEDEALISGLRLVKELREVEYELICIKERLYLELLKIHRISGAGKVIDFAKTKPLNDQIKKTEDTRGVYLWSNTLQNAGPQFLISYLLNNEINRVMFSSGDFDSLESSFLSGTSTKEIDVYRLIGENSYITKGFNASLKTKIETLDMRYTGLHLDIEPQALKGWEKHKLEYQNQLVEVVKQARIALPQDRALSISIPVFFEPKVISQLAELVDEMVVMAYANTDLEAIKRKLQEEIGLSSGKARLTIALRASDFDSRIHMEELIKALIAETGIVDFLVQDLGELIALDQKTILGDVNEEK